MKEIDSTDLPIPDFLNEDADTIHDRILLTAPPDVNVTEGDFFWDSTRPSAEEHSYMTQMKLQNLLRIAFLKTTYGPYLDAVSKTDGIFRKSATKSYGTIKINASNGTIIPKGAIVSTVSTDSQDAIEFETVEQIVINETETCEVNIEAIKAGSVGKVLKNTITIMVTPINGIKSIVNENDLKGGSDEEDDESLRARTFEKRLYPGTSGNEAHYKIWAKNVAGVGDAKVFPLWNGEGTVKVVIVDSDKRAVIEKLVQDTSNYIQTQRPAGAKVTVVSASELGVNIKARIVLARGYTVESVKKTFEVNIKSYFQEIAFSDVYTYISLAKVGNVLLSTEGVLDYSSLTLNDSTFNLPLGEEDIPVIGTILLEV